MNNEKGWANGHTNEGMDRHEELDRQNRVQEDLTSERLDRHEQSKGIDKWTDKQKTGQT